MGCSSSKPGDLIPKKNVVFVGLDNSGKSRIVHNIVSIDRTDNYVPIPTAGLEFYELIIASANFQIYDLGGMSNYRESWPKYLKMADAIVFVIDRTDKDRMCRVREEIAPIISLCEDKQLPLLILLNKSDLSKDVKVDDIQMITMACSQLFEHKIIECSAKTGDGVDTGREWLLTHMKPSKNIDDV